MARSVTLGSYTPAPIGAEGFADESDAIKRRRLQLQELLSMDQTKGMTGLAGGLANLALGLTKGYHNQSMDEQERDISRRRSEFADTWLKKRPMGQAAQEAVEGTGPLAPPPGTPGVEQAMPPPPAGEADVMEMPSANNMTPDSPALWVGKNDMSMVPRGITGDNFKANRAEKPFLPPSLDDTALWAAEGAGLSPWHAALGSHAMQRSMDVPIELEKERRLLLARKEEKEADRAARAQEKSDQRIETERRDAVRAADIEAQRERDAANRRADQDARAADQAARDARIAADKASGDSKQAEKDQKEITQHVKYYGEAQKKEKIPELDKALSNVEKTVEAVRKKNSGDVPGVGLVASAFPPVLFGKDAEDVRGAITELRNAVTVSRAGLSQTASELRNVMEELGLKWYSSEKSFVDALPRIRETLEARKANLRSTYRPEAVEIYHNRNAGILDKLRESSGAPAEVYTTPEENLLDKYPKKKR